MEEDDDRSEDFEDFDSESQEEQLFQTKNVVFPEAPSQLPKLFEIYQRNAAKIQSLRKSNQQKQQFIEGMTKLSDNDLQQDDYCESSFLNDYTQTLKIRQDKLNTLKQIYSKLNMMILEEVIQQGTSNLFQQLQNWIIIHKNVAHYNTTKNYLVILTKEIIRKKAKVHKPTNLNLSLNKKIKSGSSGDSKIKKSQREDKLKSQIFTIRLINIHHYINRLKAAKAGHPLQAEEPHKDESNVDYNQQQLDTKQQYILNDVNLVTLLQVPIQNGAMFKKVAFHEALSIFILANDKGKIMMMNKQAKQLCSVLIDQIDQIIWLQIRGDELLVGTAEGVVRVYKVSQNQITLLNMYSCFHEQSTQVDAYFIQQTQKVDKIIFYIKNQGFYLHRKNHQIVKFGDILETPTKQLRQFIISNTNIHIYHPKEKYTIIHHPQLSTWLAKHKIDYPKSTIIWINKNQQKIQILVSDPHGNNQLIII